jgi:hypothetical protein
MILSESDNRGGGRVSTTFERDFQPPAQYTQTTTKNESWVNVTTTKTESDGSRTQTSFFMKRR